MKKFNGSYFWLWTWIFLCFPVAVIYWAVKQEEVKKGHRYYDDYFGKKKNKKSNNKFKEKYPWNPPKTFR